MTRIEIEFQNFLFEIMENSLSIVNRGMIIGGVTFHEQKDLKIIFINNGNNQGILYLFTTVRAIGDHWTIGYTVNQGFLDTQPVVTVIQTTMNTEEMSNFKTEWLAKWIPSSNDAQPGIMSPYLTKYRPIIE